VRTPLTAEQSAALASAYRAGERVTTLAARYGISRETLLQHLKKHGAAKGLNAFTPEKAQRAVELYVAGMTLAEAAAATDSNSRSIVLELEARGIPRRRRGQRLSVA